MKTEKNTGTIAFRFRQVLLYKYKHKYRYKSQPQPQNKYYRTNAILFVNSIEHFEQFRLQLRYPQMALSYIHSHTLLINPLNPELNPICYLVALLGAHHFLHVSKIRVKLLTLRRLMSYIYIYIYIYIWSTHS